MAIKNVPPISKGYVRQWVRCKRCGRVAYRDYVPFSLSNPILTMPCGHWPFDDVTEEITEAEATEALSPREEYGYA